MIRYARTFECLRAVILAPLLWALWVTAPDAQRPQPDRSWARLQASIGKVKYLRSAYCDV